MMIKLKSILRETRIGKPGDWDKMINESIVDDILKKGSFSIEIGSGTDGHNKPTKDYILDKFKELILHYWMDWNFYHNETDNPKEYKKAVEKEIVVPYMKNLDKFISKWIELDNKGIYKLKSKYNSDFFESIINKHVKNSKMLSNQTKQDYYDYISDYTGAKPW